MINVGGGGGSGIRSPIRRVASLIVVVVHLVEKSWVIVPETPRPQGKREINKETIYTEGDTSRYTAVANRQDEP